MLVILRLTLGCHFLYEGVWKIDHAEKFSAKPFLTQAKGPMAPLFYAMVPDLYGKERLKIEEVSDKDGKKSREISGECYLTVWKDLLDRATDYYSLSADQAKEAGKVYDQFAKGLKVYLGDNLDEIEGYFNSLERFETAELKDSNRAAYQEKRLWDRQQTLRGEADGWLNELDAMGTKYQWALWDLLDADQKAKGSLSLKAIGPDKLPVGLPFVRGRGDLVDKAVTYGLGAIGLCLVLGLCTRLACLGGAAFMFSVLLTQPPWPTIYPPFPEVVGHSMGVDKNFVEMVALLLLATTAAGRWGGLDLFLHRWFIQPFCCRKKTDDQQ
jgi:uncharacterized membrane protein YphA (DoxX/SURF4 family)